MRLLLAGLAALFAFTTAVAAPAQPQGYSAAAQRVIARARLATGGSWVELPARALLDGASVAPRVQRLLSDETDVPASLRMLAVWACVLAVPAAVLAASLEPSVLRIVQQAAETLVQAR